MVSLCATKDFIIIQKIKLMVLISFLEESLDQSIKKRLMIFLKNLNKLDLLPKSKEEDLKMVKNKKMTKKERKKHLMNLSSSI